MILFLSFTDSRVILTGLDLSLSSIYFPTQCIFIILDCIFIDYSISLILLISNLLRLSTFFSLIFCIL